METLEISSEKTSSCQSSWSSSSEAARSMVVEKRVLLLGGGGHNGVFKCYVVKVSSSGGGMEGHGGKKGQGQGRRPKPRKVESFRSWRIGYFVSFARMGSAIYAVGGGVGDCFGCSSDVYVADMDERKLNWRKIAASMLRRRRCPETVVVHGKLYVFGGFEICDGTTPSDPWAEVYDPDKQKSWYPLRQPPLFFPSCLRMFAVHDPSYSTSKILLGSTGSPSLLAYDVVSNTWETIAHDFKCFSEATRPVLRHNKLYWIAHGVAVYDLHLKLMFTGPIIGKFDQTLLHSRHRFGYVPVVFHIDGDEFCCIWMDGHLLGDPQPVCCTTMRISEPFSKQIGGKHPVKGHCLSTQRYLVHHEIFFLFGLVLSEERNEIIRRDKSEEKTSDLKSLVE